MRSSALLFALLPAAQALNVVVSNDDGWAEINIREFYDALTVAGFDAVISAPAENQSGTGSSDQTPTTVGSDGCEFGSCPPGSPPYGYNASMPRFNYVNSYPVTSMRYGIQNVSEQFFQGPPDIAVAGPNVGNNLGLAVLGSGTVGATTEAVKEGIPGIAFSGKDGSQTAWDTTVQPYEAIYAKLASTVTSALVSAGAPYLPAGIWLNVNFPSVTNTCSSALDFRFVLSRIFYSVLHNDVKVCSNNGQLPTESSVISHKGCFASISVGVANTKMDAGADAQMFVANQLSNILTCLP